MQQYGKIAKIGIAVIAVAAVIGLIFGILKSKNNEDTPNNDMVETPDMQYDKDVEKFAGMYPDVNVDEIQNAFNDPYVQEEIKKMEEVAEFIKDDFPAITEEQMDTIYNSEEVIVDPETMDITYVDENGNVSSSQLYFEDMGKSTEQIKAETAAILEAVMNGNIMDIPGYEIDVDENGEIVVYYNPTGKYIDEDSANWEEETKVEIDYSKLEGSYTVGGGQIPEDKQTHDGGESGTSKDGSDGVHYSGSISG